MKKQGKKVIVACASLLLVTTTLTAALAATSSELQKSLQQNQQQITEAKEQKQNLESQISQAKDELETINAQISEYQKEIDDLTEQIQEKETEIERLQKELDETEKNLKEKEELLEKRLVAAYKSGDTSYLDVLMSSGDLTEFLSNYYLLEQLADSDTQLIDSIKAAKKLIEDNKVKVEEDKKILEESKETQVAKKEALDVIKKEKDAKVASLTAEEKKVQSSIDEKLAEDSEIRAAIKKAQAAEAAARQVNSSRGNSSSRNNGSSNLSGFAYPVPAGYRLVTAGLYYPSSGRYHGGTDFGAGGIYGQPVLASKAGTVILTKNLTTSYGTYIMIDHHDGTYTLYAHGIRGSICVSVGQTVSQGQQIMQVGNTGNSTGPHLHFEIRTGSGSSSERVNPLNYL